MSNCKVLEKAVHFNGASDAQKGRCMNNNTEIRLIGPKKENLGIRTFGEGESLAKEHGLDLVLVSNPDKEPLVYRICDKGEEAYHRKKRKMGRGKKHHSRDETKDIRVSMRIDPHDLETKLRKMKKLLESKYKVRVVLRLKGREIAHSGLGFELFESIKDKLGEGEVFVEQEPNKIGRRIMMTLKAS